MDYARYLRGVARIDMARLAFWAALLAVVVVAGVAVLGSSLS